MNLFIEICYKKGPTLLSYFLLIFTKHHAPWLLEVVEMAKAGIFVCLVIVIVDVAAGILSIQAQIAKDKVRYMSLKRFQCQEPNDQAFKLGLAAATLLALSHVTANLLGGFMCICCTEELERSSANRQLWFGCLVLSWIVVAVGFPALVMGTLENSKSKGSCQVLHHRFLILGGILCFVHGLLSVAFYVSATVSFENGTPHGLQGDP
ncbi:PREDICTED: uncharacterized protein LOC18593696 isoform X1 [Theobroma cacao]|uniref:Uncharacterized protein LOC18593696 isoform X1 n=1 Tax=Theobroma cacao TaxID=3641 RepID=A0AB32UY09_THECC|nr:PREDICTED: uncharacterized protein LOC18593696 isoform X1 [Theobroma cacao]